MTRTVELEAIKRECRALVRKRALVSAGVAVLPVPFLDVMVDAGILMQLIPEISQRFGLEVERIEGMEPGQREKVWRVVRVRGSQLIGIVLTRAIVRKTFLDFAGRIVARQIAKFIPLGGQLVAAGLGYFVMRRMAYKHIDDCYAVALALD